MRRRDAVKLLGLGAVAAAGRAPRAFAQGREMVIGVLYPLSGPVAQAGVDAKAAVETAADIVNTRHDLELPLARTEGLPGLGGAKLRLVIVDHQGKPELGQSEAERLITQEKRTPSTAPTTARSPPPPAWCASAWAFPISPASPRHPPCTGAASSGSSARARTTSTSRSPCSSS
jgi:hypothetical protein